MFNPDAYRTFQPIKIDIEAGVIERYLCTDLTEDMYRVLRTFTLGCDGSMQDSLDVTYDRKDDKAWAYVFTVSPDDLSGICGWAFVHNANPYTLEPQKLIAERPYSYLFTRPRYRRQGIGSALIRQVTKEYGRIDMYNAAYILRAKIALLDRPRGKDGLYLRRIETWEQDYSTLRGIFR